jgi:hypothetical protein
MLPLTKHKRRLSIAAERVQPCLAIVAELERSLQDGKPLAHQLTLIAELRDELLNVEDAVGVVTPATLFSE